MAIEDDTFRISPVTGESEYGLYSDDSSMNLTFDYAVWVNTGGRENRIGFYRDGVMIGSCPVRTLEASSEEIEDIILD